METRPATGRTKMSKRMKIVVGVVGGLVVVGLVAWFVVPWIYVEFIKDDPPPRLSLDAPAATTSVAAGATTTGGTAGDDPSAATTTAGAAATQAVDGTWNVAAGSVVGYRVKEVLGGVDTEGVGRSNSITGTMTIGGTTVTATELTVDMTTFKSDESRRDEQFNGRIMNVAQFPTATFKLTTPIELGTVPTDGTAIDVKATGDLTLHGVTRSVTFDLQAQQTNGQIVVAGSTVITFADYGIPNPSTAIAKTGADGTLELKVSFDRA